MKLLTKEIRKKLPKLYSQDNIKDPIAYVKFFCPWNQWTWFATEGEPVLGENGQEIDFKFFGFVKGFDDELGYFILSELESVRGFGGLGIERDRFFKPKPLSECK